MQQFKTLSETPPQCLNAVMAIEDWNFLEHSGYSVTGILRALYKNVVTGRRGQGGCPAWEWSGAVVDSTNPRASRIAGSRRPSGRFARSWRWWGRPGRLISEPHPVRAPARAALIRAVKIGERDIKAPSSRAEEGQAWPGACRGAWVSCAAGRSLAPGMVDATVDRATKAHKQEKVTSMLLPKISRAALLALGLADAGVAPGCVLAAEAPVVEEGYERVYYDG